MLTMFCASAVFDASAKTRAERQAAEETPSAPVTFNRDIAPIIFRSCSICHRPGEAGPFPLLNYQDVKKHAQQIAAVTKIRFMPPWLPEHVEPAFEGEMRLSDEEIDSIRKSVDQGALEGELFDLPATPKFVEGWQLGTPDVIVRAERPFAAGLHPDDADAEANGKCIGYDWTCCRGQVSPGAGAADSAGSFAGWGKS